MPHSTLEAFVHRFDISLLGIRLTAKGSTGIVGALIITGMILLYALVVR